MLSLVIVLALSTPVGGQDAQLALCRPKIVKRVSGDISQISVDEVSRKGSWTILQGPVRSLAGMGDPGPGMASTHHLIREDYRFTCWLKSGRVRKIAINPGR